jgi:hypothetical protein
VTRALGWAALLLLIGCPKKDEPASDFRPADAAEPAQKETGAAPPDGASSGGASSGGAASARPIPSRESRDARIRIDNTTCEAAAKQINVIYGRPETDPKAISLLSSCLRYGNVAWQLCIAAAKLPADVESCSHRLLVHPDDLPR